MNLFKIDENHYFISGKLEEAEDLEFIFGDKERLFLENNLKRAVLKIYLVCVYLPSAIKYSIHLLVSM